MKTWYKKVKAKTDYILEAIFQHRFIQELLDGTLDFHTFVFYVQQDSLYLSEYRRVLATLGTRLNETEHSQFFIKSASDIIAVENELHEKFLKDCEKEIVPSPTCQLYISCLSRMVNTQAVEIGLAAVLPCFTIYQEVGDYILKKQNSDKNPYRDWIRTYSSEAFAMTTDTAVEICNSYADAANSAIQSGMEEAFGIASKLEWMFWDSAYEKEQWKI